MCKLLSVAFLWFLTTIAFAQTDTTNVTKQKNKASANLGLGLGLDYGGFGV